MYQEVVEFHGHNRGRFGSHWYICATVAAVVLVFIIAFYWDRSKARQASAEYDKQQLVLEREKLNINKQDLQHCKEERETLHKELQQC